MNLQSAKIEEFDEVINLINEVFRTTRGHKPTMQYEFPLLLNKNNINNMVIVKQDGKIVSDVNYLIQDVAIQGCNIKIASIGAVCTHVDYEGNGFASSILDKVEKNMYKDGVDILLISGTRSLYTRRNCSIVDNFYKYTIKPKCISMDLKLDDYDKEHLSDIMKLYNQNSTRFLRSKNQFETLLESATIAWGTYTYKKYVMKKDNEVVGYIVLRIIDDVKRRGEVIELCGDKKDVYDSLSHLALDLNLEKIDYWVHIKDYYNQLNSYDEKSIDSLHGTVKIINFESLFQKLRPYFYQYIDSAIIDEIKFKKLEDKYEIRYKDEVLNIDNLELLNQLVLSQDKKIDLKDMKLIKEFIEGAFPINFVWSANLNYQ